MRAVEAQYLVAVRVGVVGVIHAAGPHVTVRGVHLVLPVTDLKPIVPDSAGAAELQDADLVDALPVLTKTETNYYSTDFLAPSTCPSWFPFLLLMAPFPLSSFSSWFSNSYSLLLPSSYSSLNIFLLLLLAPFLLFLWPLPLTPSLAVPL